MKRIACLLVGLLLNGNIHLAMSQEYGQVLLQSIKTTTQNSTSTTWSEEAETLKIKENTSFTIISGLSEDLTKNLKITYKNKSYTTPILSMTINGLWNTNSGTKIFGPCEIEFSVSKGKSIFCSYVINELDQRNSNYASGVVSGNNVTVIPDTAEDATLVLEGSNDMVNWEVDTLGDKPKANRKKFYRLRVKKE